MFVLYVVATPIGNLEDISLRALRILRTVKLIAAEDTRKTRQLLTAYDIKTPLTSYHEHNKYSKLDYILRFLTETGDVALVSEAGTPGISDPGHELIVAAARQGIPIVPIPGPSAVMAAVASSTLDTDRVVFVGFLPRRSGDRRQVLRSLTDEQGTMVFFEAPHRLRATLRDMLETLGERRLAVCREMTKVHEEIFRGDIGKAIEHFTEPRGEFTLVVEGRKASQPRGITPALEERLRQMKLAGMTAKAMIPSLSAETGLSRKELYRAWLGTRGRGHEV